MSTVMPVCWAGWKQGLACKEGLSGRGSRNVEQVEGSKAEGKKVCIVKLLLLLLAGPHPTRESKDHYKTWSFPT